MNKINYIAMDVHKNSIVVAESSSAGVSKIIGTYKNTESGLKILIKMIKKRQGNGECHVCYEAGPCGYSVKRVLERSGVYCDIVAPSLIPVQGGNRIKTDQRDAKKLARYYRAGELTMVYAPTEEQEAVRDLVRCREDIREDVRRYKQRIGHFLLRRGNIYSGKCNWTGLYYDWIRGLSFEHKSDQSTLNHYMNNLALLELDLKSIDSEIVKIAKTDPYREKVAALTAFRGIAEFTAMVIITEVIDFRRFKSPKMLMAFLGLVPTEYSSGGKEQKGSITKCGNSQVRKAMIESSWHYLKNPQIPLAMKKNLSQIPDDQRVGPITALKRLHKRYFYFVFKGKSRQKAIVSVAREFSGFIWAAMVKCELNLDREEAQKVA